MLLLQASAECHCMLAGESRISSNMTISAFYRNQMLQFIVPRTYLCLIIRNKIGLHLYLLPLANIHVGLFKWNHLAVSSFSLFNNRVIYLDFLFNGSTCQRLKVSRPIVLASTHALLHASWSLSLFSNSFDHHSPIISFKNISLNLCFKYLNCFCIWRIYHHYYYLHSSIFYQWQKQILFFDIITKSGS